jgi:hypothetical protein
MYNLRIGMKLKFIIILLFSVLSTPMLAQESSKVYRPDIPGLLMIDYGVNGTIDSPDEFEKGWFGSRTVNIYYYYPLRLWNSKLTFNAGIGLGFDRFKFTNYHYLADTAVQDGVFQLVPNTVSLDSVTFPGIKKSFLSMNYLDIPIEFRYNLNPDDLNRTFWVAVGARAGWMFNASTKIKQKVDGEKIVHKDKYRQGLNQFRYGATLRIGVGNFNWFAFYNLSPLFEKDKGPSATQMTTWTIGISLTGL